MALEIVGGREQNLCTALGKHSFLASLVGGEAQPMCPVRDVEVVPDVHPTRAKKGDVHLSELGVMEECVVGQTDLRC